MKDMKIGAAIFARLYIAFVAASGFIFGQLFFGNFNWPATMAGIGGLVAAATIGLGRKRGNLISDIGLVAGSISLIGVGLDALHYYRFLNGPGNYYAWFLTGPYVVFLMTLMAYAIKRRSSST